MMVKYLELCHSINSLHWNEMIRLISCGDSVFNPIVAHASRSPGSTPSMNTHFGASPTWSKLKNDSSNKRRKVKHRCEEDGYRSKIQKFLNPCKSYSSNKHSLRRRLNDLERKVNNFEKLYCNTLVSLVKESGENKKTNNSDDEVTEVYVGRNEKKKVKIIHKGDGGNKLEMDETKPCGSRLKPESTTKKDTLVLSKKQQTKKTVVNSERGSAKNRYTLSQIRELSSSAIKKEFSDDSNISVTADENGKYYFVTSTTGYVKKFDEAEGSSAPYEAATSVAKFSKKNLLYIFNQEILPRCIGSSHSNGYKCNKTNKQKLMKKYVSDKSTSTVKTLIDKSVNTKERYCQVKEDISPTGYPIDIILNTKPDTFETNPSQSIINKINKFEIANDIMDSKDICFSAYPISSSCTSFSESSDSYK